MGGGNSPVARRPLMMRSRLRRPRRTLGAPELPLAPTGGSTTTCPKTPKRTFTGSDGPPGPERAGARSRWRARVTSTGWRRSKRCSAVKFRWANWKTACWRPTRVAASTSTARPSDHPAATAPAPRAGARGATIAALHRPGARHNGSESIERACAAKGNRPPSVATVRARAAPDRRTRPSSTAVPPPVRVPNASVGARKSANRSRMSPVRAPVTAWRSAWLTIVASTVRIFSRPTRCWRA